MSSSDEIKKCFEKLVSPEDFPRWRRDLRNNCQFKGFWWGVVEQKPSPPGQPVEPPPALNMEKDEKALGMMAIHLDQRFAL
jgi:hypothetical protein